ncbi:LamG-like jellyroll fold domain-containing protein [Saccharicrinis sp. GN24d3]|uniref:LamG-like jellyroll fold domain-containing protein n=1 Tax=Saccharicrinis sp. GN24d3 TaxID=3458416 RepID=UPI004035DF2F
MRSFRFQLYLIILTTFLFSIQTTMGQQELLRAKYNEAINLVNHYGQNSYYNFKSHGVAEINNKGINGFIFDLQLNEDSTRIEVLHKNKALTLDFRLVCDSLFKYCQQDTLNVITLFFDYNFNANILVDSLKSHPINKCIWEGDFNTGWPTIGNLVADNKQIVCFAYTPSKSLSPFINYLWSYAANPCDSKEIEPKLNGEFCKGTIHNKLLYLTSYQTFTNKPSTINHRGRVDTNQDPFFISHALNTWKNTGKAITFLVYKDYNKNYRGLKGHLLTQRTISGTISYNRKPLDKVFWQGDFYAVTYGEYNFPATLSEVVKLRPECPGFKFVPEEILIEGISKDVTQNFIAIPLALNNKMSAYYPFNEEISDEGPNQFELENNGCKIVSDGKRNHVLELDGQSYMTIAKANELGISDSDFTVSAWIKLARNNTPGRRDFSILGTQENYYRGGLHLQSRDNRPYFGFFSNDLWGNTKFVPGRWYHVVWRYTKYNQEQAIFVDGKEDVSSLNHPPFVSNSNIYIGRSISQDNLFEGKIDDLIIWNRALGEEEIWNIYQDVSYINNSSILDYLIRNKFWIGALLFITVAFLLLILRKKNNIPYQSSVIKNIEIKHKIPHKNAIYLFGDFQILDKNGIDITHCFTPRLKQIFIYLLIYSKEKPHGISSDEFIVRIWPNFDRKKAINNRGVSISKLRRVLEAMDKINITCHQERWQLEMSKNVYCDYYACTNKLESNLFNNHQTLNDFLSTVQRGAFLQDSKESTFDDIKGKFSNKIIDVLTRLLSDFDINQNPEIVVKIANRILKTDDLNEDALKYKIKALFILRQNNEARFLFKSYKDRYKEIYNEELSISFEELIH